MLKRILFTSFGVLFLSLVLPATEWPTSAQGGKPTRALFQLQEERSKLQDNFDRDVSDGKAQPYEWEMRAESLKKIAEKRAAEFRITDWKREEMVALITLYRQAEMHAQAVEASRVYLKTEPKSRFTSGIRSGLILSLLELDQIEEAQKLMDELFLEMPENQFELVSRVALLKELTIAWRELGRYDMVSKHARRGYDLKIRNSRFPQLAQRTSDLMIRDRLIMAAEFISAAERLGFKKDADDSHKKVLATEFNEQEVLKSFYESELAAARLMANPAPEIDAPRWIGSEPIKMANLRGKVVLLDFWAMWCSQCAGALPQWHEFQKKFSAKGFEIIGVTKLFGRSDTEEGLTRDQELNALRNFKVKNQLSYPLAVGKIDDLTNDERYAVAGLPTVVLIDRRGNVRHIKRGVGDYRKLEKQVNKLINEK
ncbi:MAG: TlpA family protein disulfide reductase [Blastocatellia bacterium]